MNKDAQPLVTIVIPSYNHEMFVEECIKSIISQTYNNIELIIIDDGSNDNSVTKIQQLVPLCMKRFTRFNFIFRKNKGLTATLNEAIEWAKGEYFSAIASDDQLLPDKIASQIETFKNDVGKDTIALFGGVILINEDGKEIAVKRLLNQYYDFKDILLHKCAFYAATQLIKTDAIKKVGKYRPDILVEDWYMWLKLAEIGKIYCTEKVYVKYRWHANNTTKKHEFIFRENFKTLALYNTHPLYQDALNELKWIYLIEISQYDKRRSIRKLLEYITVSPKFCKNVHFFRVIRNILFR